MLNPSFDYSKVSRILVVGTPTIQNAFTISLLPLLVKAPVVMTPSMSDKKAAYEPGTLVLTEDSALEREVNGLPLDIMSFLISGVGNPEFLAYLEEAAGDFIRDPGDSILIKNIKTLLSIDIGGVCSFLTKLFWIPLVAAFQTKMAVEKFVKDNPPVKLVPGYFFLANAPSKDSREAYLSRQLEVIWSSMREPDQDIIYVLHRPSDDSWAVDVLTTDECPAPTLQSEYPNNWTVWDLITHLKEQ